MRIHKPKSAPEVLAVRVPQAALALSVSERLIWAWLENGRLQAVRLGDRTTLVTMASIRALLASATGIPAKPRGRRAA